MSLPKLNTKRKRFLNKKPSVAVRIGAFLGIKTVDKVFDAIYHSIFKFENKDMLDPSFFVMRVISQGINVVRIFENDSGNISITASLVRPQQNSLIIFTVLVTELSDVN